MTRRPTQLKIRRATITAGRLRVLASITRLTDARRVHVVFRAHRRTVRFTARVSRGRLRFTHRLPHAQRHVSTGMLTLVYPGDDHVRPARARVRARRAKTG